MNRRSFLKLSVGTALVLSITGTSIRWIQRGRRPPSHGFAILRPQDQAFFTVLFPLIVGRETWLYSHTDAALQSLDQMLLHSSQAVQKQVYDLTDLATFSITRGITTGIWRDWSEVNANQAELFLTRWRNSQIALFRQGYQGLCQLCQMAWYGLPVAWDDVGYPGPPAFLEALKR